MSLASTRPPLCQAVIVAGLPPRRGVSDTFVELFLDRVCKPFDRAGRPDAEWPERRATG
jgi:hypothetical protein